MNPKFWLLLLAIACLAAAQICNNGATLGSRLDDFLQTGTTFLTQEVCCSKTSNAWASAITVTPSPSPTQSPPSASKPLPVFLS